MEITVKGQKELHQEVRESRLCTGCGACVNLCPYHAVYQDQVVVLHSCDIKSGRCYAYCPRTPTDMEALKHELFAAPDLTPEVGAMRAFYLVRAADAEIRARAQHGGTVTALMSLALQEGLIDTAVVSDQGQELLPVGKAVRQSAGLKKRGKSRFVVSPNVAEFNRLAREGGRKIGVVATPCQSLALAKMRVKPVPTHAERIDQLKLVVGVFCGWALSWRPLLDLLRRKTALAKIQGMDIPPSKYHILQVYTQKGPVDISLDEVNACVRGSCRYCTDMTAEFTDISVGSARLPEGWDEAKGWNQLIVRTALGQELMELARSRNFLEFREVPEGNLERLKSASMNKKKMAVRNLTIKSGDAENLVYLDVRDPALAKIASRSA